MRSSRYDPIDGDVERRPKKESNVGLNCKLVNFPHPFALAASSDVASKRGVAVAIGKNDCPRFERRNNIPLSAIGKVGRMKK